MRKTEKNPSFVVFYLPLADPAPKPASPDIEETDNGAVKPTPLTVPPPPPPPLFEPVPVSDDFPPPPPPPVPAPPEAEEAGEAPLVV